MTKYSPDGTKIWTRLLGTNRNDQANALTVGLDGSIYLGGLVEGSLDGNAQIGFFDAFLTKYSPDGTKAWTKLLGSSDDDEVLALTTGLDGSIYLSGFTAGALNGQTNSGSEDAFLIKIQEDATTSTYALSVGSSSYNEGSVATFTLKTTGITPGTSVSYKISGISSADVSSGSLSGNAVVNSNGVAIISVSLLNDLLQEGPENLTVSAGGASATTVINDTSNTTTYVNGVLYYLRPPSYNNSTYTLTTQNELVSFPSDRAGIQTDTYFGFQTGTDVIHLWRTDNISGGGAIYSPFPTSFKSGAGVNSPTTQTEYIIYDTSTGRLYFDQDGTGPSPTVMVGTFGDKPSLKLSDFKISPPQTYSLSPASSLINEGNVATFTVNTSNVPIGTSVPYTLSGISVADVSGGSLTGVTSVASNGQATISVLLANDNLTEGTETLTVTAGGASASAQINDSSKSNTSTFPTVLTQQQMQNAPALESTAITSTELSAKWNFSAFLTGTNWLGKNFNLVSFFGSASSIYDINALSIDDPDYLAIFDSSGNLITSSSDEKDWAATVDSSGKSYDYDNIFSWSPLKDGTYYLGVVLSQTASTPNYKFGWFETKSLITSIPFGSGKYFYGSVGSDKVIGTSFVDVVKQPTTVSSNQITKLSDGSWQVQNKFTPSNSDNLVNVERIEFSDVSVALDVSGPAGQVAKILGSVFGKDYVSNTVFAGIGFAYLDSGMSYLDLCGLAAGAAGLSTPDLLVTTLLRNTTGTEPTALSKSSYLQSISNGASYSSVVQQIADSSANAQSIKLTDLANTGLAYTPYVLPPTYSLSASTASVNEGSTAVFNLTTTNVAVGTEVSYILSGISSSDLMSGTLNGKVTIGAGGVASINVPIASDGTTESQESLTISAQGATASIVINDTSKGSAAPTYTLTPATLSVNEGELARVYVNTTNVGAGTVLQYGVSGVTSSDVIGGLTRLVTIDSLGQAVINIQTVADQLTEGPEAIYITLGTATNSLIINDTSVTLVGISDGGGDGGGGGGGGGG